MATTEIYTYRHTRSLHDALPIYIGIDPEFGRGELIFSRYSADPSVKPNPNVRALKFPPFYALDIRPGEFSTVAGVATDAHGQILKDGYSPEIGRAHV